jgi:hypothetical protein
MTTRKEQGELADSWRLSSKKIQMIAVLAESTEEDMEVCIIHQGR